MLTLLEISEIVNGEVIGSDAVEITNISSLSEATSCSLSFFHDRRQADRLMRSQAGAILLKSEHADLFAGNKIVVDDPYLAYAKVTQAFSSRSVVWAGWPRNRVVDSQLGDKKIHTTALVSDRANVHDTALIGAFSVVDNDAVIGKNVIIGHHVTIGTGVHIGENTVIDDRVTIYDGCSIGHRCHFSSGVVIGASGFGYAPDGEKWQKIEQLGSVRIGHDVDIGANTSIDRGALEDTVIGDGVKLDNHIQIAHNVQVGDNTVMAGCVAVAGSARIGQRCRFGGRVSILGHLEIVDDVTIYAGGFVANSIKKKGEYASMIPVQENSAWKKTVANIRRLNSLAKKLRTIGKTSQ